MLSAKDIKAAAAALDKAEKTRIQIPQLTQQHPGISVEDAYKIQRAWIDSKLKGGRRIIGHKIGLTSRAMQQALNIDTPDSGYLLDDMLFPDGGEVPTDRFIGTRIEVELAFVMKSRLDKADCTLFDVMNATDYVVPALEILDTRIERVDPKTRATRKIADTIADNAANAGIVVGGRPFRPDAADLRWVSAILTRNAAVEETGVAAGVLNHPANGMAWLVRSLTRNGLALEPGQVVLSGSFVRPVEARKGDTFQADFGPFGTVGCHFA
jgi:2-oxo-hept-3-ene-1,7-dioate hydratase